MCGCIMEKRQCYIKLADLRCLRFLQSWRFDDIGSRFSACLSDTCWSPLHRIMVLYSHQLPCVEVENISSQDLPWTYWYGIRDPADWDFWSS